MSRESCAPPQPGPAANVRSYAKRWMRGHVAFTRLNSSRVCSSESTSSTDREESQDSPSAPGRCAVLLAVVTGFIAPASSSRIGRPDRLAASGPLHVSWRCFQSFSVSFFETSFGHFVDLAGPATCLRHDRRGIRQASVQLRLCQIAKLDASAILFRRA